MTNKQRKQLKEMVRKQILKEMDNKPIKLKDLISENYKNWEIGKVMTLKDNPPFKTPKQIEEERLSEIKKESAIDVARRVVKTKQYDKANGMDLTSANFIVQVYDSQKKNPKVQKKMDKMSVVQFSKVISMLR